MNGPIRDMAGLLAGVRSSTIERDVSYETIEAIGGLPKGSVAKALGPNPSKKLGPLSTFNILFALGKSLTIADDPELIALVRSHWTKRIIKGGATLQLRAREASMLSVCQAEEVSQYQRKLRMQELGRKGGKRRLQTMSKRARQRVASHAARKRWAKAKG